MSICLLEFLLMTYAFCYHFQLEDPLIQLKEDSKWIDVFNFHWRLGIDGLSLGSILLTGFMTTLATLAAWPLELIPVYLLLSMWGGKRRLYSATKFILYTAGGSIFFLIGVLDTHGEAHYSTCMLLAGILLKMGAYGLIRINMELLPHAHYLFSPWLPTPTVSHMGFIIIGIGSVTNIGLNGAILQILSHGFIGATLFFLAGTACDRMRLVYLEELGGVSIPMPKIFTMFSSFSMASLALPGMSVRKFLLMPKMLITFVMAIGMILTPIYLLSMLRQMFYGYKLFHVPNENFEDSGPRELFLLICIFLPVIGIGIYPDFVLSLSVDRVEALLSNYYPK
ncbi:hypothetical protein DAI22_10g165814 [Oryza sativa Japonica Group]|nr:hypothetical protein DAI22_10g165814 [Oryza sativa Japonica Group]